LIVMHTTKALYWAGAIGVAAAATGGLVLAPKLAAVWPGAPTAPSAVVAGAVSSSGSPAAAAPPAAASPPAADAAAPKAAATAPAVERPGFDVVRVEPSGDTVIAGHAAPAATVALIDDGRVIAESVADASGQFVIVPPPLPAGGHRLELAARGGGAPPVVSDAVTVEVAMQGAPRYAAALATPTPAATASSPKPTTAAAPSAPNAAASGEPTPAATAAEGAARVYVRAVEATADGRLVVKGSADTNAIVRLYLNDAFVADATAGQDRRWSLTIERGMSPGLYTIRADEIDHADGAVLARAEVRFAYPEHASAVAASLAPAASPPTPAPSPTLAAAQAAEPTAAPPAGQAPTQPVATPSAAAASGEANSTSPKSDAAALGETPNPPSAPPPADVVVANVQTTTVVRGDNLWDLARRFYGDGTRFRQIYSANATQIRDPNLIYIGQIFVVPKQAPP
jgi:nucleoid-associated protein YgaU